MARNRAAGLAWVNDGRVSDRTVFLHSRKRMGRLLETTGRAIGHVPFSLPQV
ncbi:MULTISPECIES: hypothetical protein [unclassified Streptomyces]|uniref:hypothetical protein n=1 Tax=unclassified Streptomyces TaxID=2593676 RepID=UPI002E194FCB|nr:MULTISPECIES: hypothetical protein [unclassified Streptomyces]